MVPGAVDRHQFGHQRLLHVTDFSYIDTNIAIKKKEDVLILVADYFAFLILNENL